MKQGWEIKRLGDVCSIGDGNYSAKYPKASEFVNSGVPFLTATNLKSGTIVPDGIRYISKEQHATLKKGHILKNDLVIVVRGSSTGNNSIVQEEYEGSNLNSQLAFLRIKNNELDSKYLFSVFNSPEVQRVVLDTITGSAQPQLPNNKLLDICIPLPPLPEQKRIVAILDGAFAAIAKAKANAEQNLKNAKELFESYLHGVFENKGEGWEDKRLGEVCELINRGVSPRYLDKNGVVVLNQKCIRDHKISFEQSRFHDGLSKKVSQEKMIKHGDVLINSTGTGTLGRVAQVREELENVTVDSHITIVRPIQDLFFIDFFGWALIFIEDEIAKMGEGCGGQTELARSTLKNSFSICFPKSLKSQQSIVQKLDALSAETKKLENIYKQKINDLEELKKSVLQKAFSGELKTVKAIGV